MHGREVTFERKESSLEALEGQRRLPSRAQENPVRETQTRVRLRARLRNAWNRRHGY